VGIEVKRIPLLLARVLGVWIVSRAGAASFEYAPLDSSYFAYERDAADVNGDGLPDIVTVQEGDTTIEWFRAPAWPRATLIALSGAYRWPRADDFKLADMDGDGDPDVLTRLGPGPYDDGAGEAAWFENPGAGGTWIRRLIGVSLEYVKDIVVADFDRDRRPDVAMRMDSRTQLWLREPGGGWTEVRLEHPAHEGMEAADLDGDGDPDLVLNGFWFRTPDTPAACRVAAQYTFLTIAAAWYTQGGDWTANSCKVAAGDIDGNGTTDVVLSHSERAGYAVTWYARSGSDWIAHTVAVVDYAHNLQVFDADLDGDADILTGGMPQSSQRGLRLLLNGGGGANWSTQVLQSEGSYSAELADLDADGDLDIIGIRNWNAAPTYLYRNLSAPAGWAGPLVDAGGGWKGSVWLGYLRPEYAPWTFHLEHGWLYAYGTQPGSVTVWDHGMERHWWTSSAVYPYVYRFHDGVWLWYLKGTTAPRWFGNVTAGGWEAW
jgi:hypothetical protein